MRKTLEYVDWTELNREFTTEENDFLLMMINGTKFPEVVRDLVWFPDQECDTVSDYVAVFGEGAAMARRICTKLEELNAIDVYVRF